MSAEHEGRKPDQRKGKSRGGSSLTDAVVAALAKVDDKKDKDKKTASVPEPAEVTSTPAAAEAGCAATVEAAAVAAEPAPTTGGSPPPPRVDAGAESGAAPNASAHADSNGFRNGPGSFADLGRRWSGAASASGTPSTPPAATASTPSTLPPRADTPVPSDPAISIEEPRASAPSSVPPSVPPPAVVPTGPVLVRYYGHTDVGLVREHNEDNFLVADLTGGVRGVDSPREVTVGERGCVFAICDGMGGAAAGEVASQMAVDTIHEVFAAGDPPRDRDSFARRLVYAIEEAGHRIFSAAKMDRTRRGMGTTATVAGMLDQVLFVGQVGDSRAYVLRGHQFEQITKDQSLVNQLIEAGQLTEEEAEAFEHNNIILQALGTTEEVTVDLTFLELRRGDRLLMCSDGLSGLVHSEMMKDVLATTPDLGEAARKLVQMANSGGGHDNISVILADFGGDGLSDVADSRVNYQQYPLPPDDTARGHGLPTRETSIKSGGPKPGADVKREDRGGHDTVARPNGGRALILIVLALIVIALIGAGWALAAGMFAGGDEEAQDVPPPLEPERRVVPPPVIAPPPVPTDGTIRIASDVEGGTLHVNGEPHGPITPGMALTLPPGSYALAVHSGETPIVSQTVTLNAGDALDVQLMMPAGANEVPEPPRNPTPPTTRQTPLPTPTPTKLAPTPRPRSSGGNLPQNPF